jgi:hypothetical protein
MVLPHTPEASRAIISAGLLHDPDLHTRLAASLTIADMPTSPEVGQALYADSQKADTYGDKWLSRAFYIAATRHQKTFTAAYNADPARLGYNALPMSVRLGETKPDWRVPAEKDVASDWADMQVPGNWESRGLPDFDGVVWFTRTFDWSAAQAHRRFHRDHFATPAKSDQRPVGTPAPFVPRRRLQPLRQARAARLRPRHREGTRQRVTHARHSRWRRAYGKEHHHRSHSKPAQRGRLHGNA